MMKTKFPFKYNKVAALMMLAPLSTVQAAAPFFLENSTVNNSLEYLYSPSEVADSEHLNLTINKLNNDYITSHQTGTSISAITSVDGEATPVVTTSINSTTTLDNSSQIIKVNPYDNSLILAYSSGKQITIQKSTDNGLTWVDQPSIATTPSIIKSFDIIINDQGEAFVFFVDTSANFGTGEIYSYDFSSETPAVSWTQETNNQIKAFNYDYATEKGFAWALNNEGRPSLLLREDGTLDTYGDDNEFTSDPLLAGTRFYITVISQDANGDWSALATNGSTNRSTYFDAAYDSNNELYVFHSNLVDPSGQVSKLTGTTFSQIGPDYITTDLIDANLDEDDTNDVGDNGRNDYVKRLKIAIDSNNVPYVAFQQLKNTLAAGKQQVQVARYDEGLDDWVEVTYDLESTDITSGTSATAVHDSFDLQIDNLDRPVLYVKTGGDSNDGFAKVLRANLVASTDTLAFSVNEGELAITTLTAVDEDGDDITLSIADTDAESGHAALFDINQETGAITFKEQNIAETADEVYNITVSAAANGETTDANLVITLVNTTDDFDEDGATDDVDEFPFVASLDSDNDGVADEDDAFPHDPDEQLDTDGDGVGDNTDAFPEDDTETTDTDGDGFGDNSDYAPNDPDVWFAPGVVDTDNDGVADEDDAFPNDPDEQLDTDADGVGDNADAFPEDDTETADTDGDGVGNNADVFPDDANESVDTDGDGVGDNADDLPNDATEQVDSDGDGVGDNTDVFPEDASETTDTDGDGVGDNADDLPNDATEQVDSDGDGVGDNTDVFPEDASETTDTDGDGFGDNSDYAPNDPDVWLAPGLVDSDNDGVVDADDAFPNDPDEQLDTDADGVGDNADVFPNDASEQFDTDKDGYGDNVDPAPNDPTDVSAPVISFVDDEVTTFVIDATGFTTELDDTVISDFIAENISATDQVIPSDSRDDDAQVVIASGVNTELLSGTHTIQLSSTDSSGNIGYLDLNVYVNPVAQLGADLVVETGTTLSVPVKLLGQAAMYPVELTYTVTPSGTGITSTEQTLTINETDDSPVITHELTSEQSGETIVITLEGATNAVIVDEINDIEESAKPSVTASIISGNVAPVVTLTVAQTTESGTNNVSTIAGAAGLVTVTANISDVNTQDEHCVTFNSIDGSLIDADASVESCPQSTTFTFDPSALETDEYTLTVSVLESNTDVPFTTETSIDLPVVAELTDVIADTDSDGIPDNEETAATLNDATQLPVVDDEEPLQVAAGLSLSLGDIAKDNSDENGFVASVEREQVQADVHFNAISTITNFNVSGLQQLGDSVSVVLPLADGVSIPMDAVYRKYTEVNGWFDFVIDENNQIASALKDVQGNCPAPESISYAEGLIEGNECIQLTIEDGGINDGDSMANGLVVDPGVLVTEIQNTLPEITAINEVETPSGVQFILNATVYDAEGDDLTYTWTQLDTDPTLMAEVVDANSATGVFIAPDIARKAELTFSLTINDGYDDSEPQEFTVKVENFDREPELNEKAGSFGWFMGLFTLAGLVGRRLRKRA